MCVLSLLTDMAAVKLDSHGHVAAVSAGVDAHALGSNRWNEGVRSNGVPVTIGWECLQNKSLLVYRF